MYEVQEGEKLYDGLKALNAFSESIFYEVENEGRNSSHNSVYGCCECAVCRSQKHYWSDRERREMEESEEWESDQEESDQQVHDQEERDQE